MNIYMDKLFSGAIVVYLHFFLQQLVYSGHAGGIPYADPHLVAWIQLGDVAKIDIMRSAGQLNPLARVEYPVVDEEEAFVLKIRAPLVVFAYEIGQRTIYNKLKQELIKKGYNPFYLGRELCCARVKPKSCPESDCSESVSWVDEFLSRGVDPRWNMQGTALVPYENTVAEGMYLPVFEPAGDLISLHENEEEGERAEKERHICDMVLYRRAMKQKDNEKKLSVFSSVLHSFSEETVREIFALDPEMSEPCNYATVLVYGTNAGVSDETLADLLVGVAETKRTEVVREFLAVSSLCEDAGAVCNLFASRWGVELFSEIPPLEVAEPVSTRELIASCIAAHCDEEILRQLCRICYYKESLAVTAHGCHIAAKRTLSDEDFGVSAECEGRISYD